MVYRLVNQTFIFNRHPIDPLPQLYPASVDPKLHDTYDELRKTKNVMFINLPMVVDEPIRRRIPIPIDHFPGPVLVDGHEEYYIECIHTEVHHVVNCNERIFVVIWAGWPTT